MRRAALYALVSAALFGLSTPASKLLLDTMQPNVLAGLLYCGAGLGIALLRAAAARWGRGAGGGEVPLRRADLPWLAGAIALGGVIGPVLMLYGLARADAAAASLLLTFEAAATALIAWFLFGENVNARVAAGMGCLIAGALVLSWSGTPAFSGLLGPLAIVGACVAWGFDNNLTRKVSLSDPLQIVQWKGLVAGPVNLVLGLGLGGSLPAPPALGAAVLLGFVSYGLSLALFIVALRGLGSARTGAYFSTAPFIGAAIAVGALQQPLTLQLAGAGILMAIGVWLHLTERHAHEHLHEPMAHAHPHVHDAHHQHRHRPEDPPDEPHTHWHEHEKLKHAHPHAPDMHHQHRH